MGKRANLSRRSPALTRCREVKNQFNQCTRTAHNKYLENMVKPGDGRPNYRARKTCTYLVDSVETCGNMLMEDDCNTEESVTNMKDSQISKVLKSIGETIADFDSCKCPAVKAHLDRMKVAEGADVVEACPEDYLMTAGASKGLVSLLLLLLLVLNHLF